VAVKLFRKYFLPGLIFQSVLIGGAYGTGRELVEFFLSQGPIPGFIGMLFVILLWGILLAISFELARSAQKYDYRSFIESLLGKGWVAYEILYVATMILVISVVASASSELITGYFGWHPLVGSFFILTGVGILAFYGGKTVENFLSAWSFVLYGVYIILIIQIAWQFHPQISRSLETVTEDNHWFVNALRYTGYNIAFVPALLFCLKDIETRKEAISAGFIGGLIGMIPAILFYFAMLSQYPEILSATVPATVLLDSLDQPVFSAVFQVVLLGTFLETGIGFVHGFNQRVAGVIETGGKTMKRRTRAFNAVIILVISIFMANQFGLVNLIAKGYGIITWGFWIVFLLPLLTYGLYKILKTWRNFSSNSN
jgi:uncharacterized membrane protein YkvI